MSLKTQLPAYVSCTYGTPFKIYCPSLIFCSGSSIILCTYHPLTCKPPPHRTRDSARPTAISSARGDVCGVCVQQHNPPGMCGVCSKIDFFFSFIKLLALTTLPEAPPLAAQSASSLRLRIERGNQPAMAHGVFVNSIHIAVSYKQYLYPTCTYERLLHT